MYYVYKPASFSAKKQTTNVVGILNTLLYVIYLFPLCKLTGKAFGKVGIAL